MFNGTRVPMNSMPLHSTPEAIAARACLHKQAQDPSMLLHNSLEGCKQPSNHGPITNGLHHGNSLHRCRCCKQAGCAALSSNRGVLKPQQEAYACMENRVRSALGSCPSHAHKAWLSSQHAMHASTCHPVAHLWGTGCLQSLGGTGPPNEVMNAAGVEFMCAESFSHRTRSAEWFALPLVKVLVVHQWQQVVPWGKCVLLQWC